MPVLGLAWTASFGVFIAWRLWLNTVYGQPLLSPGGALFVLLLMGLGWLMADPPQISKGQGWRLALSLVGIILLFSGELLLWLRVADKDTYLIRGYGLLILGAVLWVLALFKSHPTQGQVLSRRVEYAVLAGLLLFGALIRAYKLGEIPSTWWYDEVNLARAIQDRVLESGMTPVYVEENVENPGMYLWVGALTFKVFGVGITQLRSLSALFGWLSLFPFYFLARRMLGVPWGLVALAVFCAMRWTLIPQHIAFMSGFAIFWTLCAVYFYWRALGSRRVLDFAATGLCLGFTLHCYTPTRLVIPMLALFSIWHWRLLKGVPFRAWLALAAGFLVVAGPMLYYIATHWGAYSHRAAQVSIMNDVRKKGWSELSVSFIKHLQCFNFRGDFNARHNIHFWPHLDFVSGGLFVAAMLLAHIRAIFDPRAALLTLWVWIMLAAGIFSMTVEAPQGHRSILVAPAAALAIAWFGASFWNAFDGIFKNGWPKALTLAGISVALAVPLFNATELYTHWPSHSATWRSFSPESTLAARRAVASPPNWEVYISPLHNEYQFHGFERDNFVRFALKQQGRSFYPLRLSQMLVGKASEPPAGAPSAPPIGGVLAIWGDSDTAISEAMQRDFPDIAIEAAKDPFESRNNYLAAMIPWERIPERAKAGKREPFFFRP